MEATPETTDQPYLCVHCAQPIKYEYHLLTWSHLQTWDGPEHKAQPNTESWRRWNLATVRDEVSRPLFPTVDNRVERKVEVLVYIPGVGHSVFTNVPLTIVNEAIAHINDNA